MTFAVRLDTFAAQHGAKVFCVGTNDTSVLTDIRRHGLASSTHLPIAGEYMHRDAFDVAKRYGKDLLVIIDRFGTSRLPMFFALRRVSMLCLIAIVSCRSILPTVCCNGSAA